MKRTIRKAFTLVEILIVVVILGILAAIVVPQFTNATQDAQAGNIKAQLDTLNNQIELYRARNNAYPDFSSATVWQTLIDGGYIKAAPKNPYNNSSTVGTAHAAGQGWIWANNTLYANNFNNDPKDTTNDADKVFGSILTDSTKLPS
ncbi:MAG: prepilin-type N-terminal cleavage/methylation domain-containing protein [Phycisphaerales bacterium]|nr:prepilin-type N-terminal cleavage/methylation domain-containing protein [Phycisphaerales bacterium]